MRFTVATCLLIVLSFSFHQSLSQDYDFDIPEPESSGIEFNGNLDAKWGLLNTRKSSPFYGIQFNNSSGGDDVLSQYRLDFYLDGSYTYKRLGLFMKVFSPYVKEEPLSMSLYELHGSLNLSPRLSMSIGKRRFNWGKGYAFNPVGYVNAEKDPENPDLAMAGKSSVYVNYNRSIQSELLQNFSGTAILLPPDAEINQKFSPGDEIGAALKLYFLIKNIDIDFLTLLRKNEPSRIGMDFATNIRENLEIHAEYSYANDDIYSVSDHSVLHNQDKGSSWLLGFRYLNRFNTTLICEYYHNNSGLSKDQFKEYLYYLQNTLNSNIAEQVQQAQQNISAVFRSKTLMRDYLYVKLIHPEPFDLLYTSVSLFSIYNLADNSFLLSPQISYKPFTNFEFLFWPFFFIGDEHSEYGSKQFSRKTEFWLRFYF
jgi:hypothetical protein